MESTASAFVSFGTSHQIALAATVLTPLLLSLWVRACGGTPWPRRLVRFGLAAAIIGIWALWYVVAWRQGWLDIGNGLPLDLCGWAAIACAITLVRPNRRAFELAYFWGLGGTVQAVLTPDTPYDFPEIRFIVFWVFHGGIIAAVLFMVFGLKMRPCGASLRRVLLWTLGYAAIAGLADWLLGVNYGFLRAKPGHVSLFDAMPEWPFYLPVLFALGLASLALYYLPFWAIDLWKKARPGDARP